MSQGLAQYAGQRLLQALVVLLAVSVLTFALVYVSGDPVRALVPLDASPEDAEVIRRGFGLDRPLYIQYVTFIERALHGDLGQSFKYRTSAMALVVERLPKTALLALGSLALTVLVAIPMGVLAAARRGGLIDRMTTGLSIVTVSTPSFWLGMLLILLFADRLRWLPASGSATLAHLVLPAVTLSTASIGLTIRLVRVTMREVLRQNYIITAYAKGLGPAAVYYAHALRNCLIPTVTVLGLQLGALLGGAVVVETVFAWPGVGWLLIHAIGSRDLPLIRSAVLVVATLFVLINLVVDLAYSWLDPRIRYG